MAVLAAIQGSRVYLDANIWIYALEGYPPFIQDLTALFCEYCSRDFDRDNE